MTWSEQWIQKCAPFVTLGIITFQCLPSQWLFTRIEPGPLNTTETIKFNSLLICIYTCFLRAWLCDPGRIPRDWCKNLHHEQEREESDREAHLPKNPRWCRKCEVYKPPRAHHCKDCKRCIPKMDHHCPWIGRCIGYRSFPHFMRFLIFSVVATWQLEYFLCVRALVVWHNRDLPSYLGPSPGHLALLMAELLVTTIISIVMSLLCLRTAWGILTNTTAIESWEKERHEALLLRARAKGGFLPGPDGQEIRISRQEYPWDIGLFANIAQGMGTYNPLAWLWPFAFSLPLYGGCKFPDNGLEDPHVTWPPPDPDKMVARNYVRPGLGAQPFVHSMDIDAFRKRQYADHLRHGYVYQDDGDPAAGCMGVNDTAGLASGGPETCYEGGIERVSKRDPWRDNEGQSLGDFGVDEDTELQDDDDVPLAEIIRRNARAKQIR